jgi:hypothetical protein
MAARRKPWTYQQYRDALLGPPKGDVEGLRVLARGMNPEDGYNLHDFDSWTPAQKRHVRAMYDRARALETQPGVILPIRDEKKRERIQKGFHRGIPSKDFKYAWIPAPEPAFTRKEARRQKVKVKETPTGFSVETPTHKKEFYEFDQAGLARNVRGEIERGFNFLPHARVFFLAVAGKAEPQLQGVTAHDRGTFVNEVQRIVNTYDGKKSLRGTRHARDNPKDHYWRDWLVGMYGYELPSGVRRESIAREIKRGRDANKRRKQALKSAMKPKRKGRKK